MLCVCARAIQSMSAIGHVLALGHEQCAHDREDRQQTDGAKGPLSRLNHGCDLLANDMVDSGANSLYYSGAQCQPVGLPYWSVSGNPLVGDPFQLVGDHCVER